MSIFLCVWVGVFTDVRFVASPRKLNPEDVNRPEQLVPIRLEFDVEHHKMRDTFVWNLNGMFWASLHGVTCELTVPQTRSSRPRTLRKP